MEQKKQLEDLLAVVIKEGASDLHISVGKSTNHKSIGDVNSS